MSNTLSDGNIDEFLPHQLDNFVVLKSIKVIFVS